MDALREFLNNRDEENGHVTGERLATMLQSFRDDTINAVDVKLGEYSEILKSLQPTTSGMSSKRADESTARGSGECKNVYFYQNKFYHIPEGWKFPSNVTLRQGLQMWLKGQTVSELHAEVTEQIQPF